MRERFELSGDAFREEYSKVCRDFFKLPSYVGRSDLFEKQNQTQHIGSIKAETYYIINRDSAWKKAKEEKRYPEAVKQIQTALDTLPEMKFDKHDTRAIKIFFLRRLGKIYEHWATFGESHKNQNYPEKQKHFLLATYNYILGEIELGVMTEYASRISECLRGMGLFEPASQFDKAFWGPNVTCASDDIDINILKQRGQRTDSESSGGAIMENWIINLPDVDLN